jgi:hypothetical protein
MLIPGNHLFDQLFLVVVSLCVLGDKITDYCAVLNLVVKIKTPLYLKF